jgi:hypothetical protein
MRAMRGHPKIVHSLGCLSASCAVVRWRAAGRSMIARIIEVSTGVENAAMEVIAVAAGVLLLIGFICGYAVREFVSRLRRTKARRRHFERLVGEIAQTHKLIAAQPQDRLGITLQSGDGARGPPEG